MDGETKLTKRLVLGFAIVEAVAIALALFFTELK